jgi:hypothetical protein
MVMTARKMFLIASGCALLIVAAMPVSAGDHLACYKVKDTIAKTSFPSVVLVSSIGGPNHVGCIIKTGAKICCQPVDKVGVPPQPGGGGPTGPTSKFCCYKVKCPRTTGTIPVKDQFGSRTVSVTSPTQLCAPASPSGAFLDASPMF